MAKKKKEQQIPAEETVETPVEEAVEAVNPWEEKYNAEIQKYRDIILTNYGEDYILENVLYEHVMETLRTYANIKNAE